MILDLHKLRIFQTIVEAGSFTRAADQLDMTQPTISQQLAMLETQLGTSNWSFSLMELSGIA